MNFRLLYFFLQSSRLPKKRENFDRAGKRQKLAHLKFGSSFSRSPISDPKSDDETVLLRSEQEVGLDLEVALLPALELLGVLGTLGVLLA